MFMLVSLMISVIIKPIMLTVIRLIIILLHCYAAFCNYEYHYTVSLCRCAGCRYADPSLR
jgi:hypothetical protein